MIKLPITKKGAAYIKALLDIAYANGTDSGGYYSVTPDEDDRDVVEISENEMEQLMEDLDNLIDHV